jgi:hypothetical protein
VLDRLCLDRQANAELLLQGLQNRHETGELGLPGPKSIFSSLTPCHTCFRAEVFQTSKSGKCRGDLGALAGRLHNPESSRNLAIWCMRSCKIVTICEFPLKAGFARFPLKTGFSLPVSFLPAA